VFLWPFDSERYFCYEVNRACRALDFSAKFVRRFDFSWSGSGRFQFSSAADSKAPAACAEGDAKDLTGFMIMRIPFSDLGVVASKSPPTRIRMGLYRGQTFIRPDKDVDFIWTAWVDPLQSDVNFHCPETFGLLELESEVAKEASL